MSGLNYCLASKSDITRVSLRLDISRIDKKSMLRKAGRKADGKACDNATAKKVNSCVKAKIK